MPGTGEKGDWRVSVFLGTVSVLQVEKSLEMMVVAQMISLKSLSLDLEFLSSTCSDVLCYRLWKRINSPGGLLT